MSYTTRCPACGTMFKVVPDQLKISDGWVRCGHCADVFDARLYLETWVPPAPAPQPVPPPTSIPEPEPAVVRAPEPEAPAWDPVPVVQEPTPEPVHEAPVVATEETGLPVDPVAEPFFADAPPVGDMPASVPAEAVESQPVTDTGTPDPEPGDWLVSPESVSDAQEQALAEAAAQETPAVAIEPTFDSPSPGQALATSGADVEESEADFRAELERFAAESSGTARPTRTDALQAPPAPPSPVNDIEAEAPTDEPGFMRQARRRAFWRSPLVRASLGALAVLLSLLLGAQWALHERARLAASHPNLAPLLARLCEPLGCEIGPVRRIDAVVIDSSTLARRLGNFYSFDLVLKNTAALPVAVPALELSLTDTRDTVIARRVFLPQELPGTPGLLPAQGSLSLSLRLSIADAGAVSMAGYRALVFYP